jgi:hypothetical protein
MTDPILAHLKAQASAAEARFQEAEEACRQAAAQRDRLLTALQVVEEFVSSTNGGAPPITESPLRPDLRRSREPIDVAGLNRVLSAEPEPPPPPSPRLTIEQWAVTELERAGRFLKTEELTERLLRAGFTFAGTSRAYDVVYSGVFHAIKKKSGSRIVRQNAAWGLREWLPSVESQGGG